ncbi:MAG: hypothetical protein WDW38_008212 [Sanguina aurantia]
MTATTRSLGQAEGSAAKQRAPVSAPPTDFATLKRAIPKHCFERSLLRSSYHLARNLATVGLLFLASAFIDHPALPKALSAALWPVYWAVQGAFLTGIWVVAHECGHGAFSDSTGINDAVGLVLHSLLLVPYFSWKHSHRRHHKNTGHLEQDEVFVPTVAAHDAPDAPLWWTMPPTRVAYTLWMLLVGWPMYLLINASGRPYTRWASHFDPSSPIFVNRKEGMEVLVSDAALIGVGIGLTMLGRTFGGLWLVQTYIAPYLVVNMFLVFITYMQHTHPKLPHYGASEWEWMKGALATVDRSYGFLDPVLHHIGDTHVAHHLFSYMPHYHAQEATQVIRELMGEHYVRDERNVLVALWQDMPLCFRVRPDKAGQQVMWFVR